MPDTAGRVWADSFGREAGRGGAEGFSRDVAAWLIVEGLWRKRRKRGPHRRWRPPKEHFGELVQMDGSFHDWLETGQRPCLIDLVDDATAKMGGSFFEQETTEGAMRVLWGWIERYGIPRALYTDHKNLYVADREPTVDEQLAGRPALSAFGRACHKLGIQIIPAASPQAKGRIERRHGVLQDRLVKELRLRGIKDLATANGFLSSEIPRERQWQVRSQRGQPGQLPSIRSQGPAPRGGLRLRRRAHRAERLDGQLGHRWYQITGPRRQIPRRRERIVVRRRLDGSRILLRQGKPLQFHELSERPRRPSPRLSESRMPPIPAPSGFRLPTTLAAPGRQRQPAPSGTTRRRPDPP